MAEFRVYVPDSARQAFLDALKGVEGSILGEKGLKPEPADYAIPDGSLEYFRGLPGKTTLEQMNRWQRSRALGHDYRNWVPVDWIDAVNPLDRRLKHRLTTSLNNLRNFVVDLEKLRQPGLEARLPEAARTSYKFLAEIFIEPNAQYLANSKLKERTINQ